MVEAVPSCSGPELKSPSSYLGTNLCSPQDIIPLPQSMHVQETKPRRNKGKTAVLTASPYYYELQDKNKNTTNKNVKSVKRNIFEGDGGGKKRQPPKKRKRLAEELTSHSNKCSSDNDDDTQCILCGGDFLKSKPGEGWLSCSLCKGWAHEECTSYESDDESPYVCDLCQ